MINLSEIAFCVNVINIPKEKTKPHNENKIHLIILGFLRKRTPSRKKTAKRKNLNDIKDSVVRYKLPPLVCI
ncbi:hypothetical protein GCM10022259_21160 [Aquimarina mytili]